jgi:murein DD-endopeptidase MepM/ murein hydrolase activator NlpD
MGSTVKWLAVILLPLIASCSSTLGITKKSDPLGSSSKVTSHSDKKAPAPQKQDEGAFHIVGKNESLRHICEVYGLDFPKVAHINNLKAPYPLKTGDTVFLPASALLPETESPSGDKGKGWLASSGHGRTKQTLGIRGDKNPSVPNLKFPVPSGTLTSPFGYRWGKFHTGLDIAAPIGRSVLACADGRVIFTGTRKRFRRYGNTVLIDHGKGVYTYYAHLSKIVIKKNQRVRRGQRIAEVGNTGRSTGPHLHLEVRVTNKIYNPLAYFKSPELKGVLVAKRFMSSPMGPIRARWRIPDLLAAKN